MVIKKSKYFWKFSTVRFAIIPCYPWRFSCFFVGCCCWIYFTCLSTRVSTQIFLLLFKLATLAVDIYCTYYRRIPSSTDINATCWKLSALLCTNSSQFLGNAVANDILMSWIPCKSESKFPLRIYGIYERGQMSRWIHRLNFNKNSITLQSLCRLILNEIFMHFENNLFQQLFNVQNLFCC